MIVSPDALPVVRLTAPGRDLVYAGGNPRIAFDARATDDYGLRSLVLRFTKVTGSGENFEFKEGEIPLAVKNASAREWTGSVSRSLAELDLHDGDMLVYRAVAADARPGDGTATSDAFFIEISKLGVAAGDAFTLPEEESKYALSQQMLIVKTERLHQKRGSLSADDLAEQSLNLAVEQRMIRAEFVFMLGGEINDEEVEAEQSVELQAGRLQNRGQRDLRAATIAMSQAEKLLTGVNTADALVAERAAVTALQRAFSRDRYILRAMATRSQLDPARRLTGTLAEATGWRRVPPDPPVDRRTALLQDLLRGIAELTAIQPGPKGPGLQPDTGTSLQPQQMLVGRVLLDPPSLHPSASVRSCLPKKRSASIPRPRRCGPWPPSCSGRLTPRRARRVPRVGGGFDRGRVRGAADAGRGAGYITVDRAGAERRVCRCHEARAMTRLLRLLAWAIAIGGVIDPAITLSGASRARLSVVVAQPGSPAADAARDRLTRDLSAEYDIVPHVVSDAAAAIVIGDRYPDAAVPDAMLVATVSASDRAAAGVRIVRVDAPAAVPPATLDASRRRGRGVPRRGTDDRPHRQHRRPGDRPCVASMDQGSGALARERRRGPGRRSAVRRTGPAEAGHYRSDAGGLRP